MVAKKLSIVSLLLGQNPLGRGGAVLLANALGRNIVPNLKELFIEDCRVDDEGLQEIASALERNITLDTIALEDNVFSETGLLAWPEVFQTSKLWTTLICRGMTAFLQACRF
jgi:Ran GTPase-activating protein (RanGAP) involved in mRNA processing and transport